MDPQARFATVIFLLCAVWTGWGRAEDVPPCAPAPDGVAEHSDPPGAPGVHPFVPSYGFDLADIGRTVPQKLSVQLSGTLQSRHIWHGFDLMDGRSVFFPVATLTLGDTGLSAKVIGACAVGGGDVSQRDELNYGVFYSRALLPDTRYATQATLNYFYYGKPRIHSHRADAQELGLALAWPQLFDAVPLEPSYYLGRLWPSKHDSLLSGISGFIHVFAWTYNLAVPQPGSPGQAQVFKLYGDITYNDGFGGAGHGWSHIVLGVCTDLVAGKVTITPTVNYQTPLDDSITSQTGFWGGVTFTYSF